MNAPESFHPADADAVENAAALWLARCDAGLSPEEEAEFARWRRADATHEAVFSRLTAAWSALQAGMPRLAASTNGPEFTAPRRLKLAGPALVLRHWRTTTAVAAALAMTAAVGWQQWPREFAQRYVAPAEGPISFALPDQSVIELNRETEIVAQFTPTQRRIRLVRGEAHFAVAKNKARPFIVSAGQSAVRAVGTAFDVRLGIDGATTVLVTEGRVQVDRAEQSVRSLEPRPEAPPRLVDAGQRALIPARATDEIAVRPIEAAEIDRELGWKEPKLLFSETPLAEAVATFNRYNAAQLVLIDADLGAVTLGGSFRADNVEAFVRLLENYKGIKVERHGTKEIFLRKAQR